MLSYDRFKRITVCRLSMQLSENMGDVKTLQNSGSLIVISESRWIDERSHEFYGPIVDGRSKALPIPAAYVLDNGLRVFSSFKDADYVAGELWRQAMSRVILADVVEFKPLSVFHAYLALPPSAK